MFRLRCIPSPVAVRGFAAAAVCRAPTDRLRTEVAKAAEAKAKAEAGDKDDEMPPFRATPPEPEPTSALDIGAYIGGAALVVGSTYYLYTEVRQLQDTLAQLEERQIAIQADLEELCKENDKKALLVAKLEKLQGKK